MTLDVASVHLGETWHKDELLVEVKQVLDLFHGRPIYESVIYIYIYISTDSLIWSISFTLWTTDDRSFI